MAISRRRFVEGSALASILAASAPKRVGAALLTPDTTGFDPAYLASQQDVWATVRYVNATMGPTRLTGSPEHSAFVEWLGFEFKQSGLEVAYDTYTFPRWTARAWGITLENGSSLPVSSYYPHSNGFYTGTRDAAGNYPTTGVVQPIKKAKGQVVNLGTWTKPGSVNWAAAAGKIAYIDYVSPTWPLSTWYTPLELYNSGLRDAFPSTNFNPTTSISGPVDLNAAAAAGVLGVILGWVGFSDGIVAGQYNPFPETLQGGGPALWVTAATGARIKKNIAGTSKTVTVELDATIEVVPTSTVYATLPGAHYGTAKDSVIINNTHSDGPNIVEENGGIGLVFLANYFSRIPRAQRNKTMVFMASTGHFSAGFLGSGRDFITYHPNIIAQTAAVLTIEHLGCEEYLDVKEGNTLVYRPTGKLVQGQAYGPNGKAAKILERSLPGSFNRVAVCALNPGTGAPFFGEGSAFNALGIPTIGYIPGPDYLCAIATDGEISKVDPYNFYSQLQVFAKCLLAMQSTSPAALKEP